MVTKVRQGYFFHSIIIGGNAPYGVSGQPYTTTPAIIAVPPDGLLLLISSNSLLNWSSYYWGGWYYHTCQTYEVIKWILLRVPLWLMILVF